jgi:hypothetical protein
METFFALFQGSVKVVSRFHQERVKRHDDLVLVETFAESDLSIGEQLPRTLCVQRR